MAKQPSSRMCFVCGRDNPAGLKLQFCEGDEPGRVWAEFIVPDIYQGYPGVVHGGIVAAILDEVSGRAVLFGGDGDNLMATLRLTVRYRRPTPTQTPLRATGWVERTGGAATRVAGEIRLMDGTVTAECEGVLARVPAEFRAGWEQEAAYWKVGD